MDKMINEELLQQVRKEKQEYINKQFSKNPYYALLRFFGADWWFSIKELEKIEKHLMEKTPPMEVHNR